jgi:hypothetical protein
VTPAVVAGLAGVPGAEASCAVVTEGATLAGASCTGAAPARILAALCEAPRPDAARCVPRDPASVTYVLSDAGMSHADARARCEGLGGHVATIDSQVELTHFATIAAERAYPSVWIGATFEEGTWQSDTTCPALYSWTSGAPALDPATRCVATTMVADPDEGERLAGMTPTACDATDIRALCELE